MKKIYTSYYAKAKTLDRSKFRLISISTWTPLWMSCDEFSRYAPGEYLVHSIKSGLISHRTYSEIYLKKLESIGADNIKIDLLREHELSGVPLVLMCYETPDKFCHRHLLREWLNSKTDLEIEEMVYE